MKRLKELNVHIGQIRVGKKDHLLKAILGSCVGIGIIWKSKGICGLAHCLLPEPPNKTFEIGGRFVSQAIPSLMALMKIRNENLSEVEAVLAGGGNMTQFTERNDSNLVGTLNAEMALKTLKSAGIRVGFQQLGGITGRKILINCSDFTYRIEAIPRIE